VTDHTVPGVEDPHGAGARTPVDDRKVPWRVFLFIGGFMVLLGGIYWATAYEDAGTVMLLVSAVLALWIASYLYLKQREIGADVVEAAEAAADEAAAAGLAQATTGAGETAPGPDGVVEHYLPHASVWPFLIGLGASSLGVGLVLGLWVIVPGVALMALGIGGFVRQTRRRDPE
jgi:Cytochrome c oxidase subunit IV